MSKDVELLVEIIHETPNAILVSDGYKEVWLPLSQIDIVGEGGKTYVQMCEWLAVAKGLV